MSKKPPNEERIAAIPPTNQRITQLRKSLGLAQTEFARKILISQGYLGCIESGYRCVNDRIIKLISSTFGVSEKWLKTGEPSMQDDAENYRVEQAVSLFKELDPDFQSFVLKQLDAALELQTKKSEADKNET